MFSWNKPWHAMEVAQRVRPARWGLLLLSVVALTAQAQRVPEDIMERGWRPAVILAGDGDRTVALERMYAYADLRHVLIHGTEYEGETQSFLDALRASLERFDLRAFHRMLPHDAGGERQIRVFSRREGDAYRIGPPPPGHPVEFDAGAPYPMGDALLRVSSREIDGARGTHFLLRGDLRLGLGEMRWPSVIDASRDLLRLMAGDAADERALLGIYRDQLRVMNPGLATHEVNALAPVWAAYPAIWELAAGVGEIEQLLVLRQADARDRRVEASARINRAQLAKHYPAVAAYLDRLGPVLTLDARIGDEYGEVARLRVDSEQQRAQLSMTLRDGQPVATLNGRVVEGARPHLDGSERRLTLDVDMWVRIYGIVAEVTGLRGELQHIPDATGAVIHGRLVGVPAVRTSGRALGIMPAGVINFVLPRSIDQLALDFLTVAAEGNEGEGISGQVQFRQNEAGLAEVRAQGGFEALDNFMVRLGMRIVSDRLVPDAAASQQLFDLINDVQAAFVRDLDRFARHTAAIDQ